MLMRDFIQSLTRRMGINGLGRALGLNGSSVLAWVRGESLPSADLIPQLAALGDQTPETLRLMLLAAQEARAARRRLRPTLGTAAPRVVPSPKRPRKRRLGAIVLALTWLGLGGGAEAGPYPWEPSASLSLLSDMRRKWPGLGRPCAI